MPSPFPGMNPFLEQDDAWHDFHEKIIPAIAERLVVQVRPAYIVKIDEHVYVHELPPEPRRYLGRADVSMSRTAEDTTRIESGGVLLDAPAEVRLPVRDVEELAFVEIRDRRSRELVTVVEVLRPSNKQSGSSRDQYLAKRQELLWFARSPPRRRKSSVGREPDSALAKMSEREALLTAAAQSNNLCTLAEDAVVAWKRAAPAGPYTNYVRTGVIVTFGKNRKSRLITITRLPGFDDDYSGATP